MQLPALIGVIGKLHLLQIKGLFDPFLYPNSIIRDVVHAVLVVEQLLTTGIKKPKYEMFVFIYLVFFPASFHVWVTSNTG